MNKEILQNLIKIYKFKGVDKFYDIEPIFSSGCINTLAESFIDSIKDLNVDYIICPEARGFLIGSVVSSKLDIPMIMVRKVGKLPYENEEDIVTISYTTEYSSDTLQMKRVDLNGKDVLFVDDVFATGGTFDACRQLVDDCGGILVGGICLLLADGFDCPDSMRIVLD